MGMNQKRKPWLILVLMCLMLGGSIGISVNTNGVFYTPIATDLNFKHGDVSLHMTLYLIAVAVYSLWIPKLLHKYPLKRLLWVHFIIHVISTALMAVGNSIWFFNLIGLIRGLSSTVFNTVTATMIINHWFNEKKGLATGIMFSTSGVFGALFSPILTDVIVSYGWRVGYIVMAVSIGILILPALLVPFGLTPEEEGLLPYGTKTEEKKESVTERNSSISKVSLCLFVIYAFLCTLVNMFVQYLPSYAVELNYSEQLGAWLLSMGMIGNIVSKLLLGKMSDDLSSYKATVLFTLVNMAATLLLLTGHSSLILLVGAFLYGSCYGISSVGLPLCTKDFFGMENYEKIYPTVTLALNFGGALGLPLIGYLYDFSGSYVVSMLVLLGVMVTDIVLLTIVKKKCH